MSEPSTELVAWPGAEVEAREQERAESRLLVRQALILLALVLFAVGRELVL